MNGSSWPWSWATSQYVSAPVAAVIHLSRHLVNWILWPSTSISVLQISEISASVTLYWIDVWAVLNIVLPLTAQNTMRLYSFEDTYQLLHSTTAAVEQLWRQTNCRVKVTALVEQLSQLILGCQISMRDIIKYPKAGKKIKILAHSVQVTHPLRLNVKCKWKVLKKSTFHSTHLISQ